MDRKPATPTRAIAPPTLTEIEAARERIREVVVRTPLVELHAPHGRGPDASCSSPRSSSRQARSRSAASTTPWRASTSAGAPRGSAP
jgi:hypothetical protein